MQPGALDQRIILRQKSYTPDGRGGQTVSEVTVATLWARITPLRGEMRMEALQDENPRDYQITVRNNPTTRAIQEDDVLYWLTDGDEVPLRIRFIQDKGGRPVYLVMEAKYGVET